MYSLSDRKEFSDAEIFWDGTMNQLQVGSGLYLWQMELTLIDNTKRNLEGDITLIR